MTAPVASPTDLITGESVGDDLATLGVATTVDTAGDTERGYKLRHPGQRYNNYTYNSDYVWAIHVHCEGDTCTPDSQVRLRLKQNVTGGTSKTWTITYMAQLWSGTSNYATGYTYNCAVNVKDAVDKYCTYFKSDGASGSDIQAFNGTYSKTYSFGSYYTVTKFPMVKFDVVWTDGVAALGDDGARGEKFRGYDTCVTASSTRLCSTSGTG